MVLSDILPRQLPVSIAPFSLLLPILAAVRLLVLLKLARFYQQLLAKLRIVCSLCRKLDAPLRAVRREIPQQQLHASNYGN
jgi:hypothetical protein